MSDQSLKSPSLYVDTRVDAANASVIPRRARQLDGAALFYRIPAKPESAAVR